MVLGSLTLQRRFPGMQEELKERASKDEPFGSLCKDLVDAEVALRHWERSSLTVSAERCREYQAMVESLADEIADVLKREPQR
ncbi:MAG: hypothetical protein AAFY02_08675 [Pseudomonadota bacterium]